MWEACERSGWADTKLEPKSLSPSCLIFKGGVTYPCGLVVRTGSDVCKVCAASREERLRERQGVHEPATLTSDLSAYREAVSPGCSQPGAHRSQCLLTPGQTQL